MIMSVWNLDFTLVVTYLFITLIIGILKGRGVATVQQYAIADRNYGTAIITAAILATVVDGGSIMGLSEKIISHGLVFALVYFGEPITKILMATLVAPRMKPFQGMISVGDIMGHFYGKIGRVATGIAATLLSVGYIGAQASAIGYLFSFFLGIPHHIGVMIACGSIIVYSTFGGIKSVTATDIIQFAIVIISIPIIANIAIDSLGGYNGLFAAIPASHTNLVPDSGAIRYLFLGIIFYLPFLNPAITQRLLMSKDTKQMKRSMLAAAILEVPFYFYVCILALVAIVLNPQVIPNDAIPSVLNTMPHGIKGIMIVGILAVIMSTADSYLNSNSR